MLRFTRRFTKQKITFIAGLCSVTLATLVGLWAFAPNALARPMDCDSNSIIYCGFGSNQQLIDTIKSNDSGNGHHDLQAIYNYFGFTSADYSRFVSTAKDGLFYRDGRVTVGSQVIMNSGRSIGRNNFTGSSTKVINGVTYYYGDPNLRFAPGVNSIPVKVMFDKNGNAEFVVQTSCGNPMWGSKVISSATCDVLQKTAVAGKLNTFSFTSKASATGNATLTKYVYNFGDGSPTVTMTNPTTPVTHTYTKGGTFTASVTVYASAPGGNTIVTTAETCKKTFTIALPYQQCVQLAGAILDKNKYSYNFVATMNYGNGASFVSADFDFGDGTTATNVKSTNGKTVSVNHTYAAAGNYNISASLHFLVNGSMVTAPTCRAYVTPTTAPTPECKPGIPVGDVRCTPCQYDVSIAANDVRCVAPATTLPNTGAGNVVAIGSAFMVAGFLWYRHMLFMKNKRAFMAADMGMSPLPLGEPLDPNAPLAGTPLQPQRSHRYSLRRRRQF